MRAGQVTHLTGAKYLFCWWTKKLIVGIIPDHSLYIQLTWENRGLASWPHHYRTRTLENIEIRTVCFITGGCLKNYRKRLLLTLNPAQRTCVIRSLFLRLTNWKGLSYQLVLVVPVVGNLLSKTIICTNTKSAWIICNSEFISQSHIPHSTHVTRIYLGTKGGQVVHAYVVPGTKIFVRNIKNQEGVWNPRAKRIPPLTYQLYR